MKYLSYGNHQLKLKLKNNMSATNGPMQTYKISNDILTNIIGYLTIKEQIKCSLSSIAINLGVQYNMTQTGTTHILEVVDQMISENHLIRAERFLRKTVSQLDRLDRVILLNRYIGIIQYFIWNIKCEIGIDDYRKEIFDHFVQMAKRDFPHSNFPIKNLQFRKDKQLICQSVDFTNIGLNREELEPIVETYENTNVKLSQNSYDFGFPSKNGSLKKHICLRGYDTTILAYMCFKNDQVEKCKVLIDYVLKNNPKNWLAHWLSGVIGHYISKNFHEAFNAYKTCINIMPTFSYGYYSLGVLLNDQMSYSPEMFFKQAIRLDSNHICAKINLADVIYESNHHIFDPNKLKQIILIYEGLIDYYKWNEYFYYQLFRFSKMNAPYLSNVIPIFEKGIKHNPKNGYLYLYISYFKYHWSLEFKQSKKLYEKALELAESDIQKERFHSFIINYGLGEPLTFSDSEEGSASDVDSEEDSEKTESSPRFLE